MAEPDGRGKRMRAEGERDAAESQPTRTTATAPAPRPKPVAAPKAKTAPGVPMAGQSYAKKQADEARAAKGIAPPPPPTAPRPRPTPPVAANDLDLDEDFDLDAEYEEDLVEEHAAPATGDTPSTMYSTRRALAEQVNQDVGVRPGEPETSGVAALRERREAWKKMVKKKEEQGQSPYVLRWAKVSFFPLLYFIISLSLLRKIRYEYSEYYDYDPFYIILGLLVGTIFLVLAATGTMLRAKRVRKPILLKGKATWLGLLVFIGISFYLAITTGLTYAWLFSIGFLAAGLLIVGIGFMLEKSGNGMFWVRDPEEGSDKRWLEFVPVAKG